MSLVISEGGSQSAENFAQDALIPWHEANWDCFYSTWLREGVKTKITVFKSMHVLQLGTRITEAPHSHIISTSSTTR